MSLINQPISCSNFKLFRNPTRNGSPSNQVTVTNSRSIESIHLELININYTKPIRQKNYTTKSFFGVKLLMPNILYNILVYKSYDKYSRNHFAIFTTRGVSALRAKYYFTVVNHDFIDDIITSVKNIWFFICVI